MNLFTIKHINTEQASYRDHIALNSELRVSITRVCEECGIIQFMLIINTEGRGYSMSDSIGKAVQNLLNHIYSSSSYEIDSKWGCTCERQEKHKTVYDFREMPEPFRS